MRINVYTNKKGVIAQICGQPFRWKMDIFWEWLLTWSYLEVLLASMFYYFWRWEKKRCCLRERSFRSVRHFQQANFLKVSTT